MESNEKEKKTWCGQKEKENLLTDVTRSSDVVLSGSRAPLAQLSQIQNQFED